jgi:putative phosphoesterase
MNFNATGIVAVFSDAHGNLRGLEKAFEISELHGAEYFVYLGDSIGYIPSIHALELLRTSKKKIHFVKGNHENQLLSLNDPTVPDTLKKHSWITRQMSHKQIDFISSWPEKLTLESGKRKFLFVHGSPEKPLDGYIYADSLLDMNAAYVDYQLVFVGNTHIPFIRKFGQSFIVNVGSVGLPRDHGKVASLALLNLDTSEVRIIRYSISEIQDELLEKFGDVLDERVKELFERVADYQVLEEISFG